MANIANVIEETLAAMEQLPEDKRAKLAESLAHLSRKALEQVQGISALPGHYREQLRPQVESQLQAAEKRTEMAAEAFLTIAERLGALAGKTSDPLVQQVLQAECGKIFEACSFQDLVAQHLNEITLRLKEMDQWMGALQSALNGDAHDAAKALDRIQQQAGDQLLNGPSTQVNG
jgi:hypothetical protein